MPRKTPQEKKDLDYKKQRRSHWDSDKAARKAIPQAKRIAARKVRRGVDVRLVDAMKATAIDIDEAGEAVSVKDAEILRRHNKGRKYSTPETLEDHVSHQRESRTEGRLTRWKTWS